MDEPVEPTSAHQEEAAEALEANAPADTVAARLNMFIPEVLVDTAGIIENNPDKAAPTPSSMFVPVELLQVPDSAPLRFVPVDLTTNAESSPPQTPTMDTAERPPQETALSVDDPLPDTIESPSDGSDAVVAISAATPSDVRIGDVGASRPVSARAPPSIQDTAAASSPDDEVVSSTTSETTPPKFVPIELLQESQATTIPVAQSTSELLETMATTPRATPRETQETAMSGDEALPDTIEGRDDAIDEDADSLADDVEIAAILKQAASITDLAIQEGRIESFGGGGSSSSLRREASTIGSKSPAAGDDTPARAMFAPVELLSPATVPLAHQHSNAGQPLEQGLRVDTILQGPARSTSPSTPSYSDASGNESSPSTPTSDGVKTRTRTRTPRAAAGVPRPTSDNIQTVSMLKRAAKHNTRVAHIVATQKRTAGVSSPTSAQARDKDKPAAAVPKPPGPATPSSSRTTVSATPFAKLSDAKHCRFYPKKTKASIAAMRNPACGYDFVNRGQDEDDDGGASGRTFLNRMEVTEQNRRKKLETTRGEEAYMLRQNKKECPKCGMVQSFAEWRDKKKRCTFCGVLFALPKAWGDIGTSFLHRMEDEIQQRHVHRQALLEKVVKHETSQNVVLKSGVQRRFAKQQQVPKHHMTAADDNAATDPRTTADSVECDFDPPAFDWASS